MNTKLRVYINPVLDDRFLIQYTVYLEATTIAIREETYIRIDGGVVTYPRGASVWQPSFGRIFGV